jgi:hypothetical protein
MVKQIASELKSHAPFTAFGAVTGIVVMVTIVFGNFLPQISPVSQDIFYALHPTHVFLSALVTTSLYVKYGKRKLGLAVLIGYTGSIGIATLSDSIIPYFGEALLDLPNKGIHIGFIEEPLLVNPAALLGIVLGYWRPITRLPHAGHVLLSTWASLFHIIMALGQTLSWIQVLAIFVFLFLAVWIPCCVSDIMYPVLFAKERAPMLKEVKPA